MNTTRGACFALHDFCPPLADYHKNLPAVAQTLTRASLFASKTSTMALPADILALTDGEMDADDIQLFQNMRLHDNVPETTTRLDVIKPTRITFADDEVQDYDLELDEHALVIPGKGRSSDRERDYMLRALKSSLTKMEKKVLKQVAAVKLAQEARDAVDVKFNEFCRANGFAGGSLAEVSVSYLRSIPNEKIRIECLSLLHAYVSNCHTVATEYDDYKIYRAHARAITLRLEALKPSPLVNGAF